MLWRLLKEGMRGHRGWISALVAFQFVNVMTNLYLPSLNARLIDKGLTQGNVDVVLRMGLLMTLVTLVQGVAAVAAAYIGARTASGVGEHTRSRMFGAVARFSSREMNLFGKPTLMTRTVNDVQQIQALVLIASTVLVMAPIMMVGGVVMALKEDVAVSWVMVLAVVVLGVFAGLLLSRMIPGFRTVQRRLDGVNRVLGEQLTGMTSIRAFGRERHEERRFGDMNEDLAHAARRVGRHMALLSPTVMLVVNLATVALLWFGGHRVASGHMEIGSLTAYLSYLVMVLSAVTMATGMAAMVPRAVVAARRIAEVVDTEPTVEAPDCPLTLDDPRGRVEISHATVRYPGAEKPVLDDVSVAAVPGERLVVAGSTGAGKTTLVSLVSRLFDVSSGSVAIDGVDVRDMEPQEVARHVAVVPQRAYLFGGTVASNVRHGAPDATDEQVWHALEVAQAKDFVAALDGGLEAPVAQGGANLSGGQRQRLCIARALVAKRPIYVFDDAFSALDVETEARLQAALDVELADATVLVVAQRASMMAAADRVVVLDAGKAVGYGRPEELAAHCPVYREIVESQQVSEVSA